MGERDKLMEDGREREVSLKRGRTGGDRYTYGGGGNTFLSTSSTNVITLIKLENKTTFSF